MPNMQLQDLNSLTTTDLERLQERVSTLLTARKDAEKNDAIERIQALANEAGITVSIQDGGGAGGKKSAVAPRYRNPENPSDTWSGRGRAPRWLAALEAKGQKRTDFLIAKS